MPSELPRTLYLTSGNAVVQSPGVFHWDIRETIGYSLEEQGGMNEPLYMGFNGFEIRGWVGTSPNIAQYDPQLVRIVCEELRSDDMENGSASDGLVFMGPLDYDADRKTSHGPELLHTVYNYTPVHPASINHITLRLERSLWNTSPNVWQPITLSESGPTYAFWVAIRFI